tara:strand:- start:2080 stop:3006 length:927 start_codon:yes stop_codon:yes gene_type:complete
LEYLITGAAGFIGSKICERLELIGKKYIAIDDLSKGKRINIIDDSKFIEFDCTSVDFQLWLDSKKPKHIFHLCGQSSGERSYEDPTDDFIRNVLSTRRIISSSFFNEDLKSISFASSMSVYGNKKNAKETDFPQPISWYGRHKLLSENLINQFSEMRKNIICNSLRLFNVYGEGQDLQDLKQGMISIFISMAIKEKFIKIKGPSERIRDFIHVNDVVDVFLKASKRDKGSNYEVFNIGTGIEYEIKNIVQFICEKTNATCEYQETRTPFDQDFCSANLIKSSDILDFSPSKELKSELYKMIDWAEKTL